MVALSRHLLFQPTGSGLVTGASEDLLAVDIQQVGFIQAARAQNGAEMQRLNWSSS